MAQELSVNRLVRVSVNLTPLAAQRRGFGVMLIAGDSSVIDVSERTRTYSDLESVVADFGTVAPEYLAASLYFGQTPRPSTLMIGRWARTASKGLLKGGILTTAEQALSNFTSITNGGFKVTIDGTIATLGSLNFSAQTNLNGVASIINTALGAAGTCVWTGSRFQIESATTGVLSTVTFAIPPTVGVDISTLIKLTATLALTPVPGINAETPVEATAIFANVSAAWFGIMFAASTMPTTSQITAVAGLVEGLSLDRIYGVTETNTLALDASYTTDIASTLLPLNYKRTFVQYSANVYAVASFMGRAFSVDFNANRSTLTMMYKQEPGVVAEGLTETQANTLKAKRCNVFTRYNNNTTIIQYGVMSGQAYFDEIHGLSWFKDALQNALYNLIYTSKNKVPQTDAGGNQFVTAANSVCEDAIINGLIAPGQWNADGFGQLARGDFLQSGSYIYMQPMALQDQSIREQRIAPPMQIALKLAGAIHEIDVTVDVNR